MNFSAGRFFIVAVCTFVCACLVFRALDDGRSLRRLTSAQSVSDLETSFESSSESSSESSTNSPKHVVIILTDDQGYGDIGYANPLFKTPHIDSLANSGVKLGRLYVQSTCSPTRGALLTGRHSWDIGLGDGAIVVGESRSLASDATTLAEVLKTEGYRTVGIGKWHLGGGTVAKMPTSRGFDEFFGLINGANDYFDYDIGVGCNSRNPVNPDPLPPNWANNCFFVNGLDLNDNGAPVTEFIGTNTYITELFGMKAVEKIEQHPDPNTPLFMYLAPTTPHSPLQAPLQYIARCGAVPDPAGTLVPGGGLLHCAMMAALDDMVQNVTTALTNKGMMDDTMIVFLSDNGGISIFGSDSAGLRGNKGSSFDGGVRSNGFITGGPGFVASPSSTINELVDVTDIFATVADYAGVKKNIAEGGAGRSILKSITKQNNPPQRDHILLSKLGSLYGLNAAATVFNYGGKLWKFMSFPNVQSVLLGYDFSVLPGFHLYDLSADPAEATNLLAIAEALPALDEDSSESTSEDEDPDVILRGALERGRSLLAQLDGIPSLLDQAGGLFLNAETPTQLGCWIPADSPFTGVDCQEGPVQLIPPPLAMLPPLNPNPNVMMDTILTKPVSKSAKK